MILLMGIPSEPPLQLTIDAAESLGVSHVVFNQRESAHSDFYLDIRDGRAEGAIRIRERDYPLTGFSGVYVRLMDPRELPEERLRARGSGNPGNGSKAARLNEAIADWLEIASCKVMNRCSAMASNLSKPFQAQFIVRAGFLTPETLVTNDPESARAFHRLHKRVIFKSVSSERSIVRLLGDVKMNDLEKVRNLPTQFQAFVPGTNIRVHVAGTELFATEIRTEAVDYRYPRQDDLDVEMVPVTLPGEIEERCLALSRLLDLPLCGIDLKRTADGRYYCFEVNPSPGYSYYQERSGQDIAKAIIRSLQ
jgi:glutathione synthase/RimK-type ligase-like ATP-grasp enzyme